MEVEEVGGGWRLTASDAEVGLVQLDYALRLVVYWEKESPWTWRMANAFQVRRRGASYRLDPEESDARLGELVLDLRRRGFLTCLVLSSGTLVLEFADDLSIEVQPDSNFEAWDVETAALKLVVMPGGEVAVWDRR